MQPMAFTNANVILPDRVLEDATVLCRKGRIAGVGKPRIPKSAEVLDLQGDYLSPGFVDIHVHGGDGADFMDGTLEAVRTVCQAHLRHGTTTIFPTTTTGEPEQILAMLEACGAYQRAGGNGPRLAGVHLYGPYFAADKVGCHSLAGRRDPQTDEFQQYFDSDLIRIATCAAELPGADKFYRAGRRRGYLLTCGHSNASWSEMLAAYKHGMRHVDHFWCAMSSVASLRQRLGTPMQASMAEFVLMHSEMSTEVIADGCHLSKELLEFAYRMLGAKRLCLVTDCNRGLDLPPGEYRFGNQVDGSWFRSDGRVGWAIDGGSLASSIRGLDHMVRYMQRATTASLPEVIRMASLTPAERTGFASQIGSIEVGKAADLLILTKRLHVKRAFVGA